VSTLRSSKPCAIVEALTRRDGGAAAAAMLRHVENTAKSIRALLNALR